MASKRLNSVLTGFGVGVALGLACIAIQNPRMKDKMSTLMEKTVDVATGVMSKTAEFVGGKEQEEKISVWGSRMAQDWTSVIDESDTE